MGDFGKSLSQLTEYLLIGIHTGTIIILSFIWGLDTSDQKYFWYLITNKDSSLLAYTLPYIAFCFVSGLTMASLSSFLYKFYKRKVENKLLNNSKDKKLRRTMNDVILDEKIAALDEILFDQYSLRLRRARIMQASSLNWLLTLVL